MAVKFCPVLVKIAILITTVVHNGFANPWESQLYEDLMYGYNKYSMPVQNASQVMQVELGASLIRIIDVDEKNQVFTTNLWLEIHWTDSKLVWSPAAYNGIKQMHISASKIWVPDIVLYNNAAGDPDITIYNDATVHYNGRIAWKPPTIYKSFCPIDVTWFPYDFQNCEMKFGTWAYSANAVDVQFLPWEETILIPNKDGNEEAHLFPGMDLSYFQMSAEWDLLNITAARHAVIYPGCCGPVEYVDITYYFWLRRKTLFFTCNLIIPCLLISNLTTFVFYLPDKKLTFAISILVTLTVFFLILIEIIPPTSVVVPMFGQYLLYTMILLTVSILISVISVNMYYRTGGTHKMGPWTRRVFIHWLARLLCMHPPFKEEETEVSRTEDEPEQQPQRVVRMPSFYSTSFDSPRPVYKKEQPIDVIMECSWPTPSKVSTSTTTKKAPSRTWSMESAAQRSMYSFVDPVSIEHLTLRSQHRAEDHQFRMHRNLIRQLLEHVRYITEHYRVVQEHQQCSEEWRFVSTVVDRLFLVIYAFLNLGALAIILRAPSIWDTSVPMTNTPPTTPLSHSQLQT